MHRIVRIGSVATLFVLTACGGPFTFLPEGMEDVGFTSRDLVSYLARQRHDQSVFGNGILGTASMPDGARLQGAVRVTATTMGTPHMADVPLVVGPEQSKVIGVQTGTSVGVTAEGAARVFRGFGDAGRRYLSVDALASVSWLPPLPESDLNFESSSLAGAAGMRLGITSDHGNVPAITLLVMGRRLPGFAFQTATLPVVGGGTARISTDNIALESSVARLAVSKQLGVFGITAGYGVDEITVEGSVGSTIAGRNLPAPEATIAFAAELRRHTLFLGGSYRTGGVTLAGELGHLSGGQGEYEINTFASGGGSRVYLNLGLRFGQ